MTEQSVADAPLDVKARLVTLELAVSGLHDARKQADALATEYKRVQQVFQEEVADLVARKKIVDADVAEYERAIKGEAAELFKQDPSIGKAPVPGVGIRVGTSTTFDYSEDDAIAWGKANTAPVLKLDRKAFEKIAEASPAVVPFVKITTAQTVSATIATDLDAALGAGR